MLSFLANRLKSLSSSASSRPIPVSFTLTQRLTPYFSGRAVIVRVIQPFSVNLTAPRHAGPFGQCSYPKKTRDESKPPEWVSNYDGELMICVKVVKFLFKWKGLQSAVEKFALDKVFHDVFLDSHRALMSWAKDWFPMTMDELRAVEKELEDEQKQMQFEKDEEEDAKKDKKDSK